MLSVSAFVSALKMKTFRLKSPLKGNMFFYLLTLQTAFKRFSNKLTIKHNSHVIINTNGNKWAFDV